MSTGPCFRQDPFSGEWVIVAGERQHRPALPEECPFCTGGLEAPEPYTVKAFTNRWPVMSGPEVLGLGPGEREHALAWLSAPPDLGENSSATGVSVPALGAAEVVLYTPDHHGSLGSLSDSHLEALWALWTDRTEHLFGLDHLCYVLIFENRGPEVGVTIEHPHGQIYGFPFVPPRIRREVERAATLRDRHDLTCLTCKVAVEERVGPRLVYEDEESLAFVPYASAWPYALTLVPRAHVGTLPEMSIQGARSLMRLLRSAYAAADALFDRPLPTMMAFLQSPTPRGKAALADATLRAQVAGASGGADPDWHLRIEIVSPMRKKGVLRYVAGAEVASGVYQNPVDPEYAAAAWRTAFERAKARP